MRAIALLALAVVLAGCASPPAPEATTSGDATPSGNECPLAPADAQSHVTLRVATKLADQKNADRADYAQGNARLHWDGGWHGDKPLTSTGCATFTIPRSATLPVDIHVKVPDKLNPTSTCGWFGMARVPELSAAVYDVVATVMRGCYDGPPRQLR